MQRNPLPNIAQGEFGRLIAGIDKHKKSERRMGGFDRSTGIIRKNFSNEQWKIFTEVMKDATHYEHLFLLNEIDDDGAKIIASLIKENRYLNLIRLNVTHLGETGLEAIFEALKQNRYILSVNFENIDQLNPKMDSIFIRLLSIFLSEDKSKRLIRLASLDRIGGLNIPEVNLFYKKFECQQKEAKSLSKALAKNTAVLITPFDIDTPNKDFSELCNSTIKSFLVRNGDYRKVIEKYEIGLKEGSHSVFNQCFSGIRNFIQTNAEAMPVEANLLLAKFCTEKILLNPKIEPKERANLLNEAIGALEKVIEIIPDDLEANEKLLRLYQELIIVAVLTDEKKTGDFHPKMIDAANHILKIQPDNKYASNWLKNFVTDNFYRLNSPPEGWDPTTWQLILISQARLALSGFPTERIPSNNPDRILISNWKRECANKFYSILLELPQKMFELELEKFLKIIHSTAGSFYNQGAYTELLNDVADAYFVRAISDFEKNGMTDTSTCYFRTALDLWERGIINDPQCVEEVTENLIKDNYHMIVAWLMLNKKGDEDLIQGKVETVVVKSPHAPGRDFKLPINISSQGSAVRAIIKEISDLPERAKNKRETSSQLFARKVPVKKQEGPTQQTPPVQQKKT